MKFGNAIKHYWTNYAVFKGRTSRSTFWWAVLFTVLVEIVLSILFPERYTTMMMDSDDPFMGYANWQNSAVQNLWSLASFLPSLSLLVRRLHDTNRSGHFAWFTLLPVIGWIMTLVFVLQDAKSEGNRFGEVAA